MLFNIDIIWTVPKKVVWPRGPRGPSRLGCPKLAQMSQIDPGVPELLVVVVQSKLDIKGVANQPVASVIVRLP